MPLPIDIVIDHVLDLLQRTEWYEDQGHSVVCNACHQWVGYPGGPIDQTQHADDCPLVALCELLGQPVP